MSDFGDYEPEDAWDVDDDAIDMARNLQRRLDALDRTVMRDDVVDVMIGRIEERLAPYRRQREQFPERERLRIDQLIEDLPVLREKARHA